MKPRRPDPDHLRGPARTGRAAAASSAEVAQTLQRGIDHHRRGAFKEAEYFYQLVLRDHPGHPEALNLMGTLAIEAKRFDVSIDCLEKAVRRAPKKVNYRNNLANSYILDGQPEKALPHLRKALAAKPKLIEALMNTVRAYRALGKDEPALENCRKALKIDPRFVRARVAEAEILTELGRMEEATRHFRAILEDEPDNAAAIAGLATAHRFTPEDRDIERIETVLSALGEDDRRRIPIHHAAGKIHNDLGDYDAAVGHFSRAKALAGSEFDLLKYRKHIDRLRELFTPLFFLNRKGYGSTDQRPVFIVGMPRSGTTLTEQIIASHPQAAGAGELQEIGHIISRITQVPRGHEKFAQRIEGLSAERAARHAERYLTVLKRHSRSALRVVDKMPHNFEALGVIALMFPEARVVHCRRDPMDNCVSCFTHHFSEAHGYNTDLEKLGLYYREYDRLMAHWKSVLPLKMMDLSYEDMISDQEGMSRTLISFLDLPWDEACLRFHETERTVQTPSRWQVRQPIYRSSVKRWKRYERHLGPLKQALGTLFREE